VAQVVEDPMTEFREPPVGWYTFGTHAGPDAAPEMEFSVETDDVGDPLWERPVQEDSSARLAEAMCRVTHSTRFEHAGVTGVPCDEHLADAEAAVAWVMQSSIGAALGSVLLLHRPGSAYRARRNGPRGGRLTEVYMRHDCEGENAPDEYPVEWPCETVRAIAAAGMGVAITVDGKTLDV